MDNMSFIKMVCVIKIYNEKDNNEMFECQLVLYVQ